MIKNRSLLPSSHLFKLRKKKEGPSLVDLLLQIHRVGCCFLLFANESLEYFERAVGPHFDGYLYPYRNVPLVTGRLSQTIQGGGKRRLFAICNYVKQRLLFPVHKWAMEVLSRISTDGTFDQERPLLKLRRGKKNECYSFDLKSATDCWPLSVMYSLMSCMFGYTFASSIVNNSLGLNTFMVGKPITKIMYEIAFLCGQLLGYYGSWSLFSLSHHYIVWLAAKKAYPHLNRPFKDYALLSDDILITDKQVALQYRKLLDQLGVTISDAKSIVSDTGAVEFTKKFWVKSMQIDLSPISLRLLLSCRTTLGLCTVSNKYPIGISILQRLGGAGFRVRSRLYSTQSKRWERFKAAAQKPNRSHPLPLEYWIGRGKPLNPYLKGKIVDFLRKELKPKEIRLFPEEMVFDKERDILEHTVIHNWVKMWLKWCSWYYTVALSEDVSLDQLMDVPMCSTTWRRSTKDLDMIKFGLIWKCYDMGAGWDLTTTPSWIHLWAYMPRFKELPDATSFALDGWQLDCRLPSSMVAILLNNSLVFAFNPIYPCNADSDILIPGLGTPRICMQDEPTGVPINRATRVGFLDLVAGESLIKKQILERFFIDLVAGESLIKERAAARFNDLVGSTDVVAGEPLLLLPRRFRQNRAWMELNKIW
ncbi:hypothetical protein BC332_32834 [Capsicum chinense]|nr:hypothetical protein BC332_32834 [Capsicum chinense]